MNSARNQLILLGFICQGLTWDDYFLPLANILLWLVCLGPLRERLRLRVGVECLLLFGGCIVALVLGRWLGRDTHFFIGHGLTLMQAARLLRPLDRREQVFSILMACFQLGVACAFLFDLRFIPVFLATLILLPKAFMELEAGTFASSLGAIPSGGPDRRVRRFFQAGLEKLAGAAANLPLLRWLVPSSTAAPVVAAPLGAGAVSVIFAVAVVFFVVFPRGFFGGVLLPFRGGSADATSLLDSVVDPTRSANAQSRRVLLQLQGEKIGYLRCYSLSEFDGVRWRGLPGFPIRAIRPAASVAPADFLSRRVYVKQVNFLGRILPTDGRVQRLTGRFFRNPMHNAQDAIQCESMWNTANNSYEYWIDPHAAPEPFPMRRRQGLTKFPPQSDRLQQWLETLVAGETNRLQIARRLEDYLKQNFKYALGAPELRRLNPVDDFVFNQQEGHCERFASTLALLLRMENIPSRVVIGYLPRRRGGKDNWYTVRFNDAHAWTEAYFEDIGWMTLDATPAATLSDSGWLLSDWWDTVDLAWNLHVVNFDASAQRFLLDFSWRNAGQLVAWTKANALMPAVAIGLAFLATLGLALFFLRKRSPVTADAQQQAQIFASHYYGELLRALAHQGFHRQPQETPFEFVTELAAHGRPWLSDAQLITRVFCEARYGNQIINPAQQMEITQALERVKRG
jgi:transglutaminase-like putative cysteine protease